VSLPGLDTNVRADDCIDRAIFRDDVVGAGIEPDDRVRLDVFDNQLLFTVEAFLGLVDVEAQAGWTGIRISTPETALRTNPPASSTMSVGFSSGPAAGTVSFLVTPERPKAT
jgi:hypothetical protein